MSTLAVDPGLRYSGCAVFQGPTLYAAALVKNPVARGEDASAIRGMVEAIELWLGRHGVGVPLNVVVERMQVYGPDQAKGDPNDLITLSLIAGMLDPTHLYLPREWKGQVPKDTMGARILSRLSVEERARIVDAGTKTHNIIDAVGIGLHHLNRLAPRRVYAR